MAMPEKRRMKGKKFELRSSLCFQKRLCLLIKTFQQLKHRCKVIMRDVDCGMSNFHLALMPRRSVRGGKSDILHTRTKFVDRAA